MNILINHCWCSDSIWGGVYNCRCIVSLDRIPKGKKYHDPVCPDWALVKEHPYKQVDPEPFSYRDTTLRLRDDVRKWLETNIKDRKLSKWSKDKGESARGWAIGSDEYNSTNTLSFAIFFERQNDGMAFIKHWSVYKNPISYLQYFKDIRKELDTTTGKLKRIPR